MGADADSKSGGALRAGYQLVSVGPVAKQSESDVLKARMAALAVAPTQPLREVDLDVETFVIYPILRER